MTEFTIHIERDHEVNFWSKKWGVPTSILKEALTAVGPLAKNVETWLRENNYLASWSKTRQ
jgi:hypothetical protein